MQTRPVAIDAARSPVVVGALLLLVAAASAVALMPFGRDTVADGWDASTDAAGALTWLPTLALVLCSGLHYVAAAGALRASTDTRLPFGLSTVASLAASSANKIAPAGLGGSALLARFLVRRGGVPAGEAVGSVGVVAAGRAVAAVLTLGALAALGPLVGADGARSELVALPGRLASPTLVPWVAGAAGAAAVLAAFLTVRRRRSGRSRTRLRDAAAPLRLAVRNPRRLAALLGCSAAQSLLLGVAFAAATLVVPGHKPAVSLLALVVGYLIAAALAAAVPTPGGIGSAEAALTAVLVAANVPLGHALVDVTVFRVLTMWVPAAVGLPCIAALRRRGAL